ncbi:MAG: cytochrome c biogenesis protein CcsA [Anaeromyxobacter sp.]|nr:cytochrome c biogenesis protein CcsA [Anaeromyxobacter sp.]MBL0275294.1 cytochrome c biogenesis protein CcsA [Anaeromyxobacter sp.]
MSKLTRYVPWAAGALALLAVVVAARPPAQVEGLDLDAFARIPVLEGGRVKPVDSVARISLLMIRSKQSQPLYDAAGNHTRTITANEWLLDLLFRPEVADQQRTFYIDDPEVLALIGQQQSSNRYYSFAALLPHLAEIERQGGMAQGIDPKQRTRFQGAVANLYERVFLHYKLKNTVQLAGNVPLALELGSRADPASAPRHQSLAELAQFRILPPQAGVQGSPWRSTGEGLRDAARGGPLDPGLEPLARMGLAYAARDASSFNRAVAELTAVAQASRPEDLAQAGHEIVFNRVEPFYLGMAIYVLAMLAIFASWLRLPGLAKDGSRWGAVLQVLQPTAFALLVAGSIVHTLGLVSRVILQGRPPVTNLYSSAVFVGWGAVILGVVLERLYRRGFATAVAAATGFASLIVAHHLSGDGDTMEMMRAVLDSNFWLGTHVITITIGYSGTFLAGAIAIAWTIRKHFGKGLDVATSKMLTSMAYGIICFALFFSFIGTVLGGIWADQSWGRFWGWDPKENGALLIVLWNAIILHARWGGYARDRGIMAMAIFGNVITALSWFGVNMLGVGLHSYGFMDKAFWSLSGFCASQLALIGLALAAPLFTRGAATPPAAGGAAASRA